MLDSNSLYVTDELGNEKRMEILFTFEDEEHGKKYVVFADPDLHRRTMMPEIYCR